ncbi:hypothetical protein [Azospirillum picis]|uniref:DUF2188 domain-containing protein n=1 Tax=Azospirillum picis TaxID=488438 RepID=A0ABU0MJZ2_9PROT|nr:hypothetical protein [Azospirillum picis]MBP2299740.1 hypothetical protein [Azospirillum picis]MDQ0533536.1 hypothetical protein [Azospirillum picis]
MSAETFPASTAARKRLAFFVLKTHGGWIVRADGFVYPPCADYADALAKAISEARAAGRLGFASTVLAQSASGELCRIRWTYEEAADPPGGGMPGVAQGSLSTETPADPAAVHPSAH